MRKQLLALFVLLPVAPAMAQEDHAFTGEVLTTAATCFSAPDTSPPESVITICTAAEESLGKLILAKAGPSGTDLAVYRTMLAIVDTTLGAAQGQVDGARSQRSCNTMERAWLSAAYIDPPASPDHTSEMAEIKGNVARAVRSCRETFDAPFAAPALPTG